MARKAIKKVSKRVKKTSAKKIEKVETPSADKISFGQVRQYSHNSCRYVIIGSVPPFSDNAQVKCRIEYNLECPIASQGVYQKPSEETMKYLSFLEKATIPLSKDVVSQLKSLEGKMRTVSDKLIEAKLDESYSQVEEQMKVLNRYHAEYIILQKPELKLGYEKKKAKESLF